MTTSESRVLVCAASGNRSFRNVETARPLDALSPISFNGLSSRRAGVRPQHPRGLRVSPLGRVLHRGVADSCRAGVRGAVGRIGRISGSHERRNHPLRARRRTDHARARSRRIVRVLRPGSAAPARLRDTPRARARSAAIGVCALSSRRGDRRSRDGRDALALLSHRRGDALSRHAALDRRGAAVIQLGARVRRARRLRRAAAAAPSGMLMDLESHHAWERHIVRVLDDDVHTPQSALAQLADDAERVRTWRPGDGELMDRIAGLGVSSCAEGSRGPAEAGHYTGSCPQAAHGPAEAGHYAGLHTQAPHGRAEDGHHTGTTRRQTTGTARDQARRDSSTPVVPGFSRASGSTHSHEHVARRLWALSLNLTALTKSTRNSSITRGWRLAVRSSATWRRRRSDRGSRGTAAAYERPSLPWRRHRACSA